MLTSRSRLIEGPGIIGPAKERIIERPGPEEALIQVHATSVNFHDIVGVDGLIPGLPVPRVPFSDASATVVAIGDRVKRVKVGDKVIPNFFPYWISGAIAAQHAAILGDQLDGTLQSHVCLPEQSLAVAPKNFSHEEVATLGCAALTAWRVLFVEAALRPGQTVVLQGTGGVSLMALGFAKMAGARTILTSSSDEKLERARALGADETINYKTRPDWDAAVMELTGGVGADVIVDVGGAATLNRSVNAVRFDGHIGMVGVLTGFEALNLPIPVILGKNIAIKGVTVGCRTDLEAMCRSVEIGAWRPVIDCVFDLDETERAIAHMKSQSHFGKIVVRID